MQITPLSNKGLVIVTDLLLRNYFFFLSSMQMIHAHFEVKYEKW